MHNDFFFIGIDFWKATHPRYASFHMRLSSLVSDIAFLILLMKNISRLFFFFLMLRERCAAVLDSAGAVYVCGCLCFAVLEVRGDALSLFNEEEVVAGSLLTVGSVCERPALSRSPSHPRTSTLIVHSPAHMPSVVPANYLNWCLIPYKHV